jgi:hypothetical protein
MKARAKRIPKGRSCLPDRPWLPQDLSDIAARAWDAGKWLDHVYDYVNRGGNDQHSLLELIELIGERVDAIRAGADVLAKEAA